MCQCSLLCAALPVQHGTAALLLWKPEAHTAAVQCRMRAVCLPAHRSIGCRPPPCSSICARAGWQQPRWPFSLVFLPSLAYPSHARPRRTRCHPCDDGTSFAAVAGAWRQRDDRLRRSDGHRHPASAEAPLLPEDFGLFRFASIFNECAMVHSATRSCSDLFTTIKSMNIMLYVRSCSISKVSS